MEYTSMLNWRVLSHGAYLPTEGHPRSWPSASPLKHDPALLLECGSDSFWACSMQLRQELNGTPGAGWGISLLKSTTS